MKRQTARPESAASRRPSLEAPAPAVAGTARPAPGPLTPATALALQRTAGNRAVGALLARGRHTHGVPVQRAAGKVDEASFAEFTCQFANFVHKAGTYDNFEGVFWEFKDEQDIYNDAVYNKPRFQQEVRTRIWDEALEDANAYRTSAKEMGIATDAPIRLYRKMSAQEAAVFTGAGTIRSRLTTAMNHNSSDQYRKYFTTSLSHTSVFSNANSSDPDDERVLEFTLKQDDYWAFLQRRGTPNQLPGAFNTPNSAVVNQEQLRAGPNANFRTAAQVDEVYQKQTHHNVGIGHGNVAEFARMATSIREVAPEEVPAAVAAARATMLAALKHPRT
ncbi:hypothetical protein ACFU6K_31880 [Kitasatospora sp. NPDC057512]|uniref:hypothetical protein n=1 Tax=Kitasatospora sp. NPDC057512 TaxID=3346154 RepID=UPI0036C2323B